MSFFDEVETTVANCFPVDHQVYTEHGFLSLSSIQQHFTRNSTLNVACFDDDSLQFHPITSQQLTVATGDHKIICIENSPYSLSLMPTANHRMYIKPAGSAPTDAPYSIQTAASLTSVDRIAFQCVFPKGFVGSIHPSQLPFTAALSLTSDAHIEAFLWLYGYWIGDGWLDGEGAKVKFGPKKQKDVQALDAVFAALPLKKGIDWSRTDAANANGQWDYTISAPAWWKYFGEQYGHKYSGSAAYTISLEGAHRRGSGVPKGRYTAAVSAGEVAALLEQTQSQVRRSSLADAATSSVVTLPESQPPDAEDLDSAKWFFYWYGYLPIRYLRVMVAGLRFADGNESSEHVHGGVIYTSSLVFREQLVDVFIRAGYSTTIKLHQSAGQQMGVNSDGVPIVGTVDGWIVEYTDNTQQAQPVVETSSFRQESMNGTVWCVTVPTKDQLILVRRVLEEKNGVIHKASRPVVCGNTRFLQAIEDHGPITLQLKPIGQLQQLEGQKREGEGREEDGDGGDAST